MRELTLALVRMDFSGENNLLTSPSLNKPVKCIDCKGPRNSDACVFYCIGKGNPIQRPTQLQINEV